MTRVGVLLDMGLCVRALYGVGAVGSSGFGAWNSSGPRVLWGFGSGAKQRADKCAEGRFTLSRVAVAG